MVPLARAILRPTSAIYSPTPVSTSDALSSASMSKLIERDTGTPLQQGVGAGDQVPELPDAQASGVARVEAEEPGERHQVLAAGPADRRAPRRQG